MRRALIIALPVFAAFALVSLAHAAANEAFSNPLHFPDIKSFVQGALKALVIVALPVIGFFIVYSGFLFVFARGSEQQLEKAKTNFVYVIIGSILILGAWVIATLIGSTVSQLVG